MNPTDANLLDEKHDDAPDSTLRDWDDFPQGMLASPTRTRL
ncbi:hypothetical protein BH09ACT12_BH09ACT12_28960 [soil metagenome]